MFHHHHHHRPYIPPYQPPMHHHRPPPYHPPPPPPPPPPEILEEENGTGAARCYFCGRLIRHEADVGKTKYHVGHGHNIFVTLCPGCQDKKNRGEGPFAVSAAAVLSGVVVVIVVGLFAAFFFGFWLPGFTGAHRDFEKARQEHEKFKQQFDEDWNRHHQQFDEDWNRNRPGF